ncbi:phosphatase PAP2 family protein [Granulicella cerasi]|uniref:Phosphatase PAP2 family protein n=1 Tax=Granulicella cerasi TaxID=741063 RepID=A0ABW1Z9E3_9BACT
MLPYLATAALLLASSASAQEQDPVKGANLPNSPSSLVTAHPAGKGKTPLEELPHPEVSIKQLPLNVAGDTFRIFLSPLTVRPGDLKWLLPIAGAAAGTFASDTHVSRDVVSHQPSFNSTAGNLSDGVRDAYYAAPVVLYITGHVNHDEKQNETAVLSGEAMIDAYIIDSIVKLASYRERPDMDNARGNFYQTSAGYNSSFISGHAMNVWSASAVIAAEYPNPWMQAAVYTAATSVSVNRVLALKHFPTDVLLGSAGGWLIGHYVVRAHHRTPIYRRHAVARITTATVQPTPPTMAQYLPARER